VRADRESDRGECETIPPPQLRFAEERQEGRTLAMTESRKEQGPRRTPTQPRAMTRTEIRPAADTHREVTSDSESSNANQRKGNLPKVVRVSSPRREAKVRAHVSAWSPVEASSMAETPKRALREPAKIRWRKPQETDPSQNGPREES